MYDDDKPCAANNRSLNTPKVVLQIEKREMEQHFHITSASGLFRNYGSVAAQQTFWKTSPKDVHAISSW